MLWLCCCYCCCCFCLCASVGMPPPLSLVHLQRTPPLSPKATPATAIQSLPPCCTWQIPCSVWIVLSIVVDCRVLLLSMRTQNLPQKRHSLISIRFCAAIRCTSPMMAQAVAITISCMVVQSILAVVQQQLQHHQQRTQQSRATESMSLAHPKLKEVLTNLFPPALTTTLRM